jgi:hypothetical protein
LLQHSQFGTPSEPLQTEVEHKVMQ